MKDGDLNCYLENAMQALLHLDGMKEFLYYQRLADIHPGNILRDLIWYISDLGISGPADDENYGKVYGVLPYVAPEQLISRVSPFVNTSYDIHLARNICNELRLPIIPGTPDDYAKLMKQCWNADPLRRPKASLVQGFFQSYQFKFLREKSYEILELEISSTTLPIQPSDITTSKILDFKNLLVPKNLDNTDYGEFIEQYVQENSDELLLPEKINT
ncbi:14613_t:CDS:2 [Dentiscutata erythropus]|uniref:14613_t:CDS:1 n=1 Tax=Dentiscutata erythropus TaxID=1348616 RepID=A0A9N9HR32_9GLOM|nr:14613_t:CDS:2 [Dentiscutata erythropus]